MGWLFGFWVAVVALVAVVAVVAFDAVVSFVAVVAVVCFCGAFVCFCIAAVCFCMLLDAFVALSAVEFFCMLLYASGRSRLSRSRRCVGEGVG